MQRPSRQPVKSNSFSIHAQRYFRYPSTSTTHQYSAMSTNATCPGNASIPSIESLPVPQDINVMVIPGSNASYPPMRACCQPNKVAVVNDCWLWCEVPKSYFERDASQQQVQDATSGCLRAYGRNGTAPEIIGWQFNTGARAGMWTVKELGVLVLALSGLTYIL